MSPIPETFATELFLTASPVEIALVLAIALLLFGPKLVPWLARRLGRSTAFIRHSEEAFDEARDDV